MKPPCFTRELHHFSQKNGINHTVPQWPSYAAESLSHFCVLPFNAYDRAKVMPTNLRPQWTWCPKKRINHVCFALTEVIVLLLPARASEQGNVIGLVSVYIITLHAQREQGKVIGRGVHIYIYI